MPNATDAAAARIWNILAAPRQAGLITLAEQGLPRLRPHRRVRDHPYKGRNKPAPQKDANRAQRPPTRTRRTRQRPTQNLAHPAQLRCCPRRAGRYAKAIHVLQNYEITTG